MPKHTSKRHINLDRPIQSRPSPVELDALQQYFAAEIAEMLSDGGSSRARINRIPPHRRPSR